MSKGVAMIEFLGTLTLICLIVYVLLLLAYRSFSETLAHSKTIIDIAQMPALKPIPIATDDQEGFLNKLLVILFNVRRWRVEQAFVYEFNNKRYAIPAGFTFDGASIPKLFWTIISPVGPLLVPGLLHDYGYRYNGIYVLDENDQPVWDTQITDQAGWDELFRATGDQINQMPILNNVAHFGLWLGGFKAWQTWRDEKEKPEPFQWEISQEGSSSSTQPKTEETNNESVDANAEPTQLNETAHEQETTPQPSSAQADNEENKEYESGSTKTTKIGYVNPNNQEVLGTRKQPGTDKNQLAYKVKCLNCHAIYGANGAELYRRKCPECQGGKPGIDH